MTAAIRKRPQETHSLILLQSDHAMPEIRRHLRRFTMLQTPADPEAPVYFRFYDPRVMIDAMESMRPGFWARFMELFRSVVVPVTPYCLLPEGIALTGSRIGPFDPADSCQGRLLRWALPERSSLKSTDLKVTEREFDTFSERMERRAIHKMARRLHEEHRDVGGSERCLSVAFRAKVLAAEYGLTTVKQVTILARCMLYFGEDFTSRNREASRILNDRTLLPWQKKNQLIDWFIAESRNGPIENFYKG
ncbi:DUF4123 domain-containing protein [Paracoccus methylarcula]|uniref:DUF4123 domain-containing protein n=1 Tax=Paracoccus methylarcula TaxID=72022 RepID=A0A3R7NAU2_9RHOB|nr:DUF4123 domain-containing protein [Paracoccus methylarcula]RNF33641.1 DUF4123 domain-containing protein [Paracoccus methylarcula]